MYNSSSFHLQPSSSFSNPPPLPLHINPLSLFPFLPFSDWSNIWSSWGLSLFIFWSAFSAAVWHVWWLNSAVSDIPVFGLAAGDGGRAGVRDSECVPATQAVLLLQGKLGPASLTHTVAIHSPSTQDRVWIVEGQWQCQECWTLVPPWEKKCHLVLCHSPSLSHSLCLWKVAAVWWEGSLVHKLTCFLFPTDSSLASQKGPPSQRNSKESHCFPHWYFLTQSHIPSGSFIVIAMKKLSTI